MRRGQNGLRQVTFRLCDPSCGVRTDEQAHFSQNTDRTREHWRIAVPDPFYEFEPVRSALATA